jgi:poly-beta-hydroxybutyrate-responsive repressor
MPPKQRRQTRHLPAFVLLVLAEAPRHGGAVHSSLLERLNGLKVDTAAVYRTLQALETDGEVSSSWDTSNPGPARKIYSLTALGRERLAVWKEDIESRLLLLRQFLEAYGRLPAPPATFR